MIYSARAEREKQLAENLQRQGVAESSFPQYGTNFWGNSANNYGFGVRNIAQNAQNHPAMSMTLSTNLSQQGDNVLQTATLTPHKNYIQSSNSTNSNPFDFINNEKALINVALGYNYLSPLHINDKYKHSVLSCLGAQGGIPSTFATAGLGVAKEIFDIAKKSFNPKKYGGYGGIMSDSWHDIQADIKGLSEGYNNQDANCYDIMKNFYQIDTK